MSTWSTWSEVCLGLMIACTWTPTSLPRAPFGVLARSAFIFVCQSLARSAFIFVCRVARMSASDENLNPVQQRCLAVLHGSAPCSDELRRAAERLLASGGELTKSRGAKAAAAKAGGAKAGGARAAKAGQGQGADERGAAGERGALKRGWSCPTCTLDNAVAAPTCAACGAPPKRPQTGGVWACGGCTLEN
eukprot:2601735-Prymnesium_polylepis.1